MRLRKTKFEHSSPECHYCSNCRNMCESSERLTEEQFEILKDCKCLGKKR